MTGTSHASNADTRNVPPGGPLGRHVTVGGVVSTIVTVCVSVAVRSFVSCTVQVTMLDPIANLAGALFVIVTEPPSQISAAFATPMRCSAHEARVRFGGAVMIGVVTGD